MQIDRIDEVRLSAEDDAGIARLLARSFATDFGGRSYYQQRHAVRIVARSDGAIVGHMALCFRDVRLGEALVPVIGLAEVATDPDQRGKGVATKLLRAAIDEAYATPARFFLLFGDRPIYAAHGFVPMPNVITYLTLDGAHTGAIKTGADGGLMVRDLGRGAWDGGAPLDLLGHKF